MRDARNIAGTTGDNLSASMAGSSNDNHGGVTTGMIMMMVMIAMLTSAITVTAIKVIRDARSNCVWSRGSRKLRPERSRQTRKFQASRSEPPSSAASPEARSQTAAVNRSRRIHIEDNQEATQAIRMIIITILRKGVGLGIYLRLQVFQAQNSVREVSGAGVNVDVVGETNGSFSKLRVALVTGAIVLFQDIWGDCHLRNS